MIVALVYKNYLAQFGTLMELGQKGVNTMDQNGGNIERPKIPS